jgi:hypothetical protein
MNRGQRQAAQKGQVGQDEVRRLTRRWLSMLLVPALGLPEPPDQHRPERPVLVAVDQELDEDCGVLGFPSRSRSIRPLDLKTGPRAKRGQVLALALYHRHWLWISFPRG